MRKYIYLAALLTGGLSLALCAQREQGNSNKGETISVLSGVQNIDKKVLKDPDPQIFPFIAIKFRTASVGTAHTKGQDRVTAKSYAILDGIDSALFQQITDEFYKSFSDKLKAAGVSMVDFQKIQESKEYKKWSSEPAERHYNHKDYGTADVYTNNNVPFFDMPSNALKIMKLNNDCDGGVAQLRLVVDFVEFDMEMKKSWNSDASGTWKTVNASAEVLPSIKITQIFPEGTWDAATSGGWGNGGGLVMSNKKGFACPFTLNKPLYHAYDATVRAYDEKVPEFAKKKYGFFGGAMQLGTFVVMPDPQVYKQAALDALNKYADMVVEIIKSYKK